MPQREDAWLRHQQTRWLRPDGDRWLRPDAARFLVPGSRPLAAYPALALKSNPNQPRLPAGRPDGGQWTSGGAVAGRATDQANSDGSIELPEIVVKPEDNTPLPDVQPAGDVGSVDGPAAGVPSDEPPEIPEQRPTRSWERNAVLRNAADWLARNGGLVGNILAGANNNALWFRDYHDLVQAARDRPKSLQELMRNVGRGRPGYDDHHIVEQSSARSDGYRWSQINDPTNIVSIPRLRHYQITGWYMTKNVEFGYETPRSYLQGKDWNERRRVGLGALRRFGVLKP